MPESLDQFWQQFIKVQHETVTCPTCLGYSEGDPGSPQPSWAGTKYAPGGLIFVLQNPGAAPREWSTKRDQRLAEQLNHFRDAPTVESYAQLTSEMHSQMQGTGPAGPEPWPQWRHPVSKCIAGCLTLDRIVWANLVRHRTPGHLAKDMPPTRVQEAHGLRDHLGAELDVLRPRVVVAVGAPAARAMETLSGEWTLVSVGQRASDLAVSGVRARIRELGVCVH